MGALQQLVYRHHRIRDVEHLKEVLQTCWEQISQDTINCAVGQFHQQLSFLVATGGGHIESIWAPLWLLFFVLHVHYHTYVFCCRNTELGQQKQIVRFILRHSVLLLMPNCAQDLYISCQKNREICGILLTVFFVSARSSSYPRQNGSHRQKITVSLTMRSLSNCGKDHYHPQVVIFTMSATRLR